MKKEKRILITGANGFLGKWLTRQLRVKKCKLFLTDLTTDKENHIEGCNLTIISEVKRLIEQAKPEIVYHLGGFSDLSRNFSVAQQCIDINLKGIVNLLDSLKGSVPEKFIFVSSEEVYGNGQIPYQEVNLPNPPSPYSISKIASENFCAFYGKELGFSHLIVRLATTYGPCQPLTKFIPQMIVKALKNEDILLNSGRKKRDYLFISDAIRGLVSAKDTVSKESVINLGGGRSYTLLELAKMIVGITKSKSKILLNAFPDRTFEADEWLLDISRAKKYLHWEPEYSLKEGLEKTIKSYKIKSFSGRY